MTKRSVRLGRLDTPKGIGSSVYFFSLIGPLVVSAALGIQLLLTTLVVLRPPDRRVDELSEWGEFLFYPEWDIMFYLISIVLTLAVGMALVWLWNRRLRSADDGISESFLLRQAVFQLVFALTAMGLFLHQFMQARLHAPSLMEGEFPSWRYGVFAMIALTTLGVALSARTPGGKSSSKAPPARRGSQDRLDGARRRWSIWDLVVPLVIVALIYVPTWRQVAGRVFLEEALLHWDYFAMGPALSYRHGFDLGSQVHSAYGFGWPMFFSALSEWIPLSYGRMIQIGSIYACAYLVGVYLLLRLIVTRPSIAALGTGLAMTPFFLGMEGLIIWRVPNVTVMRWPFDVWCLIALIMYGRSTSRMWAAVSGAIVGLAIFFVIDTGVELAAAVSFFWLSMVAVGPEGKQHFKNLVVAAAAALGTLAAGLLAASRGGMFSMAFVRGWLEAPLEFGGGFGMLPVATFAPPATIVGLSIVFVLCLTQVGYTLSRVVHYRARFLDVFSGCLALYGVLILIKFMGHSAGLIFPRLLIPSVLLLTVLLDRTASHAGRYARQALRTSTRTRLALGLPWIAVGLAALILATGPGATAMDGFSDYPNLITTGSKGSTPEGVCLMAEPKDLCGLPETMSSTAGRFQTIVARLESLQGAGKSFGVIDETGSLFYAATDTAPFGRYSRPFTATHTKELVAQMTRKLDQDPPDYILTRLSIEPGTEEFAEWSSFGYGPDSPAPYSDTWKGLLEVVHRRYQLQTEIRPFQIWRLMDGA